MAVHRPRKHHARHRRGRRQLRGRASPLPGARRVSGARRLPHDFPAWPHPARIVRPPWADPDPKVARRPPRRWRPCPTALRPAFRPCRSASATRSCRSGRDRIREPRRTSARPPAICFPPPSPPESATNRSRRRRRDRQDSWPWAAATPAAPVEHIERGLLGPADRARVEVHRHYRVGGLHRRIGVPVAGGHVEQFAREIEGGRRPDGGARWPVVLHARGTHLGGLGFRGGEAAPDLLAGRGFQRHHVAAERAAGVLRIGAGVLFLRCDGHVQLAVVQFGRAGDAREGLDRPASSARSACRCRHPGRRNSIPGRRNRPADRAPPPLPSEPASSPGTSSRCTRCARRAHTPCRRCCR